MGQRDPPVGRTRIHRFESDPASQLDKKLEHVLTHGDKLYPVYGSTELWCTKRKLVL
jgi:hypothetical protein